MTGKWMRIRVIGQGAFAKVYLVRETGGSRTLACKVAETEQAAAILEREAKVQRRVEHPLFARYEDFIRENGEAMLLMEYVEGANLSDLLKGGALPAEEAVRIALKLAEGLDYLHGCPGVLLYRDLKPDNIRITPEGDVKLLDLGCVCSLDKASYSRAGSRGYAAPEQLGEGKADRSCDVYALGKVLHQMLTGQDPCVPPFHKQGIRAYDLRLSPLLERLVEQCTAEEPSGRLPDMRLVARQLRKISESRKGLGLWLRERWAMVQWLFSGKKWETDFLYEKCVKKP